MTDLQAKIKWLRKHWTVYLEHDPKSGDVIFPRLGKAVKRWHWVLELFPDRSRYRRIRYWIARVAVWHCQKLAMSQFKEYGL